MKVCSSFRRRVVLILRSIAPAMRLEGWPRATTFRAAILRDAREERAPQDEVGARLDMISFKESLS